MLLTTDENALSDVATTPVRESDVSGQKLVLAAVHKLNAESIAWCLSAYGSFRDVEAVGSVEELLSSIRTQRPKLILIGERIVAQGLREILSELAVRMGETRVAVFADDLTDRQLDLVANNRVTAILSRKEPIRALNEHLVRAVAGTRVLSPALVDRVQLTRTGDFSCSSSVHLKRLTDRQWDVLLRIAEGRRVSEVATDLHISAKAVESHKYRIMKTVGATDRVELCRWAIREGLIDP